ncbi:ATP-binding protein [Aeromonas salmonicida]|uniref:ATP-binding protein n=1 Tax=Aeromonas salmonicida TaxID=645 RepID=UPI0038BC439D
MNYKFLCMVVVCGKVYLLFCATFGIHLQRHDGFDLTRKLESLKMAKMIKFMFVIMFFAFSVVSNAEALSLSQRVISETNDPSLNLDYIVNFKSSLSPKELAWLSQRDVITVGVVNPLTPPLEILTVDKKVEGVGADILSILEKVTNKTISIKVYASQQQALAAIARKEVDMLNISSILPNTQTDNIGDYSASIMLDNCAYLASFKKVSKDGHGITIAYEAGGIDKKALIEKYPKAMLVAYPSIVSAFDSVQFGQSDAILASISSLSFLGSSRVNDFPVKERTHIQCIPLQFFIAKDSQPFKHIMNKLIAVLQKSSLMGMIDLRWRGGNYKTSTSVFEKLTQDTRTWLGKEHQVTVGLLKSNFPFSFINANGQWQGIIIDVLNQIRYSSGLSFEFVSFDNFNEMSASLISNSIDMIGNTLAYQINDEMHNSIPYSQDDFLVLISSLNEKADISKILLSEKHMPPLHNWLKSQSVSLGIVNNDSEVMDKFEHHQAPAAVVPYYVAEYYHSLSKRPYRIIKRIGPDNIQRSFSVAYKNKALLEVINASISSISPAVLSDLAHFWRISPLPPVGFYAQYENNIKTLLGIILPLLIAYTFYSYRIHQELSARKKLEKVLLGQLDLMQSLLDGLPHPVTLVNADGTVIYSNKPFLTAVGCAKEGMQGVNISKYFNGDNNNFTNTVGNVVKDMSVVTRDSKINVAGSLIDIHEWFIPYHNIYDDSTGVLWGWFDVTWRNEICRQLEHSKQEADLANQAKSEFIATISHEIRTPINIINGFLTLVLERTTLNDIDREELEYTKSAADGLLCLVGDVLDVTKIEAGQLSLEPLPINMGDLVHDVVAMFLTLAKAKKVALRLEGQMNNSLVQLDPLRTKQILFNLVGNAVKFTHAGTVTVSVSDTDSKINISIQDSGIGIDDDKLADLFQPFVQVHDEPGYQGSGLGLSITKRLCELMGGSISISSEKGKGTKVAVILPQVPANPNTLPVMSHSVAHSNNIIPANINVLIIDDHPVNLILLRRRLLSLGFNKIHEAGNGWQALDIVKSEKVQVIITDCQMLGMDGFTLVEALRQYEAHSGCARHIILGLTASGIIQDREKGMAAGMDACMFKPIDNDMLYGEIMVHLHDLDLPELNNSNADSNNLLKNGSFFEMVQELTTADLVLAHSAYAENDIEMFSMLVHRIKGVFLMIKHDDIVNCCKEIEAHLLDGTHAQQIIATLDRIQELMKYIKNES